MERFIRVQYYPRQFVREGSIKAAQLEAYSTYIRLDTFLQINDLEPLKVYENSNTHHQLWMSHCYLNRVIGLGINGVTSDIFLTENSYNEVLIALGIKTFDNM